MADLSPMTGFAGGIVKGLHADALEVAVRLAQMTGDDGWIIRKIKEASQLVSRRDFRPGEAEDIVRWARFTLANPSTVKRSHKSVRPSLPLIHRAVKGGGVAELKAVTATIPATAAEVLDRLYPPTDYVFIGSQPYNSTGKTIREWTELGTELGTRTFIVPNPFVDGAERRTGGFLSHQRFIVHEVDRLDADWKPDHDQQASIILQLSKEMPLRLVVDSGNSSLHGWFDTSGCSQPQIDAFIEHSLSLGGDPMTLRPTQLVRLPLGSRDGKPQRVLYIR